jgi:3-deoxy-manno-octulosonate cytidylyltransferase (CMP-KDO synthetase)
MKVVCVIPARLDSKRFPRKILSDLNGKTLLERVWLKANQTGLFHDVIIALDAEETASVVNGFGGKWKMTSKNCNSGTERLIELQETFDIEADVFVNWQADEPLICKEMILDLLRGVYNPLESIWTLKKEAKPAEFDNPNVVKVVTDKFGRALYFSRSKIPFDRDQIGSKVFKHIGLYAYRKAVLAEIKNISLSNLAEIEKLEQLAFLENGLQISVYPTHYESTGVDIPQDLEVCKISLNS